MVICAIELLGLFYSFQNGVVKWESLWVIFVEVRAAALSRLRCHLASLRHHAA